MKNMNPRSRIRLSVIKRINKPKWPTWKNRKGHRLSYHRYYYLRVSAWCRWCLTVRQDADESRTGPCEGCTVLEHMHCAAVIFAKNITFNNHICVLITFFVRFFFGYLFEIHKEMSLDSGLRYGKHRASLPYASRCPLVDLEPSGLRH